MSMRVLENLSSGEEKTFSKTKKKKLKIVSDE